jgi:hypothetical protein
MSYEHGEFCWNELMTRKKDAARKFYSELLGWKAEDAGMPGMDYTIFKVGDKMVGGMMDMPADIPEQVPSHWMAYVAVDDVDAAAARVADLGGQLLHGPADIPNVGRFCVVQDPSGGAVSLIKMSS